MDGLLSLWCFTVTVQAGNGCLSSTHTLWELKTKQTKKKNKQKPHPTNEHSRGSYEVIWHVGEHLTQRYGNRNVLLFCCPVFDRGTRLWFHAEPRGGGPL